MFEIQNIAGDKHIYPIETPAPINIGCVELETYIPNKHIQNNCSKNEDRQETQAQGCFESAEQKQQQSPGSQNNSSDSTKACPEKQYNGPWYNRTEDWIDQHPFGQKIKKALQRSHYTNQGKRAFKVIENIENCDGFKKGDYIVVDAMHKDHLEVFGKDQKWKSVANFDGTKNEQKTEQGRKEPRQPLRE